MVGAGVGVLMFAIGVARSAAPVPIPIGDPDPADRQAFVEVCGACHPVSMVDSEVRSYDHWRETVRAMVERGAKGTDTQFERIDNYLYLTMTALNVNDAASEDVAAILGITEAAAEKIVARRETKRFTDISDLAAAARVPVAQLEQRKKRVGF